MTEVTALTKDKLLHVLGYLGNHRMPIPIDYIQQLYDKYGDKYDFETSECKLISENSYWRSGWRDKNGTFTNDYYKYKEEIENLLSAETMNKFAQSNDFESIPTIYDSPITLYTKDIQHQISEEQDNLVMKAVHEMGVTVDKDKLLQILNHDQERYRCAYAAGYAAAKKEFEEEEKT